MHVSRLLLLVLLAAWPAAAANPPPPPLDPIGGLPTDYKLVWADEFDEPGLPDPRRWAYDTERNREGWWNGEAQYYSAARAKNARIKDGVLIIEAHRERLDPETHPDWGGQDYTSSRMTTNGRAEWTYGFIEVRAKLPCGRGSWAAIWTLGAPPHDYWPGGGEIDILEHVGYASGVAHAAVHTNRYNHTRRNARIAQTPVPDACDAFHTYQLHWTRDRIVIGVDGRNYYQFLNDHQGRRDSWPFDHPQYLLLNIAIGGGWGGNEGIDDEAFPMRMEVDYVRVYQHDPG